MAATQVKAPGPREPAGLTMRIAARNIRNMRTVRKYPRRGPGARVSATEAAKNFGRLVDRVREERVTYVVERGGTAVARIAPIDRTSFTLADFKALITSVPSADEDYLKAVEEAAARHNKPRQRRNPWER